MLIINYYLLYTDLVTGLNTICDWDTQQRAEQTESLLAWGLILKATNYLNQICY